MYMIFNKLSRVCKEIGGLRPRPLPPPWGGADSSSFSKSTCAQCHSSSSCIVEIEAQGRAQGQDCRRAVGGSAGQVGPGWGRGGTRQQHGGVYALKSTQGTLQSTTTI